MNSNKENKKVDFFEDAGKSDNQVFLADMHGDGVHFNRELHAKAKRNRQIAKEKAEKARKKKNNKKNL